LSMFLDVPFRSGAKFHKLCKVGCLVDRLSQLYNDTKFHCSHTETSIILLRNCVTASQ